MPTTELLQGLPIPVSGDANQPYDDIGDLALAVRGRLVMVFVSSASRAAALSAAGVTATEGMLCWLQTEDRYEYHDGTGWKTLGATRRGLVTPLTYVAGVASGSVVFSPAFVGATPTVAPAPTGWITSNTPYVVAIVAVSLTGFDWEARPGAGGSYAGTNQPGFRWLATNA